MQKSRFGAILFVLLFGFLSLSPLAVAAQAADPEDAPAPVVAPKKGSGPPAVELINPIGGTDKNPRGIYDTRQIFGNAIKITMGFLGSFTLAVFFYGGYMWLVSAGNSEKVQKGTKTMVYAVIGLFIIFGAYGILSTVIGGLRTGATGGIPRVLTPQEQEVQDADSCQVAYDECIEKIRPPLSPEAMADERGLCQTQLDECNE
jgi:hypothetical protein